MARVAARTSRTRGAGLRGVLAITEVRLAGYTSILLGVALLVVAVTYVLLPGRPTTDTGILFLANTSPGWFRFLYGVFAVGGVLGLAVVGPITRLAGDEAPAWLAWARRLAYLGFAVTIVQGVRMWIMLPELGQLWNGCGQCTLKLGDQQTMARWLYATTQIDPHYVLTFGLISLWTLAVSVVALVSGALPRPLAWLGVALTGGYWLIVIALTSGQTGLFSLAAVVTGVFLGPSWYIWLGVLLTARAR